ncbi:MAG TPA: HEAT repeat domain-containing protein [Gemmataceae bacterium]|jgi:HEAT repeat protein
MKQLLLVGACLLLAGCGGKATTEWVAQLRDKDSAQRLRAIKALGEKRSEPDTVVPALAQALSDENAFVRRDAARALGRFGPAALSAVPDLRVAAKDRNQHVRQAATEALQIIAPDDRKK